MSARRFTAPGGSADMGAVGVPDMTEPAPTLSLDPVLTLNSQQMTPLCKTEKR